MSREFIRLSECVHIVVSGLCWNSVWPAARAGMRVMNNTQRLKEKCLYLLLLQTHLAVFEKGSAGF